MSSEVVGHHKRVAYIAARLGKTLALPRQERALLFMAAILHDVGGFTLQSRLAALSFEADGARHAELGYRLLRANPLLKEAAVIVRHHHTPRSRQAELDEPPRALELSCLLNLADRVDVLTLRSHSFDPAWVMAQIAPRAPQQFAPADVDALAVLAAAPDFWAPLAGPDPVATLEEEPLLLEERHVSQAQLEQASTAFSQIIDFRSRFTATHSRGVAETAVCLAEKAGMADGQLAAMRLAGNLHDLGKLAVPSEIIDKPGPLDDQERAVMDRHPELAQGILSRVDGLETVAAWASQHHERLDGRGYPRGLVGTELSLGSRIMSLADVFTALREDRPYRRGLDSVETLGILDGMAAQGALDRDVLALARANWTSWTCADARRKTPLPRGNSGSSTATCPRPSPPQASKACQACPGWRTSKKIGHSRTGMSDFAADLHIHSRFSRATSKGLTVRSLAAWAEVKGIGVLGTGDCTHPGWLAEVERELAEDGSGLLRLRDPSSLAGQIPGLPVTLSGSARFMLQGEISSIYKRGGRVRKVHNLVYLPTLQAAKSLNAKLAQVGNLAADGRPILGLDSRNLLEMVLETHPEAFLVPAHIWTPWFALFGSMSGFDSVEECFGDLAGHIFAMETGLSSDPAMNWTLSALDRYRMISNSDAHSGEKLGREANLLRGEASFSGIRGALRAHLPMGRRRRGRGLRVPGHCRILPGRGQISPRRAPQVQLVHGARRDPGPQGPVPGVRQARHPGRAAPGAGPGRPSGARAAPWPGRVLLAHPPARGALRSAGRGAGQQGGDRRILPPDRAPGAGAVHSARGPGAGHRPRRARAGRGRGADARGQGAAPGGL